MISKRQTIGNCILLFTILVITTLEWHFASWYDRFTPYGTSIMFVGLVFTALCYLDIKETVKDPVFWMVCATVVIAFVNLLLVFSNKGCILVVADMSIALYMADKIRFTKKQALIALSYVAFFFIYWTIDVKGYFKGYNTNYGGLILITGFACLMILSEFVTYYLRNNPKKYGVVYIVIELFLIALAFNIISWYRSRTALIGLLVLLVIKAIPRKLISNKVIYFLITIFGTVGGTITSLLYVFLGEVVGKTDVQLFYKSILSGREILWKELWLAFLERPLTGIGSSYEVQTEFMHGMLEVHNGMLDILIVHGVIVFIPICLMFTKRLLSARKLVGESLINKAVYGAVICMLATSFFENFIIVQPFTLIILVLLSILNTNQEDIQNK